MQHLTFVLQVKTISKGRYHPFKVKAMLVPLLSFPIVLLVINFKHALFYSTDKKTQINDAHIIHVAVLVVLLIQILSQGVYIVQIVTQVADVLKIKVFKVKENEENRQLTINDQVRCKFE
mmetsp:Transcript_777/g.1386  ORF Transcript_777/g.1386 Transcript_777/m.1386 type:complete len:120 (+) Transcript_777:1012-1371(+)